MLTTMALVTALCLAPAQNGELRLINDRTTYGVLGPVRADNKFLPGDKVFVTFDIDNLRIAEDGKALYSMGMELTNAQGKTFYKRDPADTVAFNALGGSRVPAFAYTELGIDTPEGEYTLRVVVKDRGGKEVSLNRKFQVVAKDFGLVRLQNSYDPEGRLSAPPIGVAGQSFFINFFAVGFKREGQKMQPNLALEMRVFDESGKPTLAKSATGEAKEDVPLDWNLVPMQFILPLNRSGKFTVKLKATDMVTKKTAELSFPLTVEDAH